MRKKGGEVVHEVPLTVIRPSGGKIPMGNAS
jgi:hypothetical protein